MATKINDTKLSAANMDRAASELKGMDYNVFKQGAEYDGLKKSYEQQGRMAMQDTIGQAAARTGGMASSYATSVGQQSYNNYMQTLENAARSLYASQRQEKLDDFSLASSLYDRNNAALRNAISDERYDAERNHSLNREAIEDKKQAQNEVMVMFAAGVKPSADLLRAAGWYDETTVATAEEGEGSYPAGLSALGQAYYKQATLPGETSPQYTFDVNDWEIASDNIKHLPEEAAIDYLTGLLQAGWPPEIVYSLADQYGTLNETDILDWL